MGKQAFGKGKGREMKSILAMAKYRYHIWKQGHLYVMPLVMLALYGGFCYSIRPARLVTCVVMLCFVLFFTMVWMGHAIGDREDPVQEQLLYLRVLRKSTYYIGRNLFLLAVQLIFAALGTAMPLLLTVMGTGTFSGETAPGELAQSFFLLWGCAGAGIALGSLLSPRVMRDRRLSLLLTVLLTAMSVLSPALKKYAVVKWLVRLLPPISAVGEVYGNCNSYVPKSTFFLWGILLLYSAACLALRDIISHKRGFL